MGNIDIVSKYLGIYDEHYLKGNKDINEIHYIVNVLHKYSDKLDTLDELFICKLLDRESSNSTVKERFGIDEIIILLDKKGLDLNNRYCFMMESILITLLYSHESIDNKELMELVNCYAQMRYGFEAYISESNDFRTFVKELEKNCGYNFKTYLFEFLIYICAYIYYNSLDPELLRDVSIVFMCHYEEVIDILKINGFGFYDSIDNDYFNHLINLILSVSINKDSDKKVLS